MDAELRIDADADVRLAITGAGESHLKLLREALGVQVTSRGESIRVTGDPGPVRRALAVLRELSERAESHQPMDRQALLERITWTPPSDDLPDEAPTFSADHLDVYLGNKAVRGITEGQRNYLRTMSEHDLTICTGPAGTGKTYLAVAAAVAMLKRGLVRKLILARPAVEAGEKLGFLPGTMQDKVNPYLRPLLDALQDMMAFEQVQRFMANDLIEVIPLAFMRGRTLNHAWIILDEAQNTTRGQMMMFLTRLGHGSKMVVTGDTSQIDLEDPRDSGLIDAARRLRRTQGVGMVSLGAPDIVRHGLVQRIIAAYEPAERRRRLEGVESADENPGASPSGESSGPVNYGSDQQGAV
ncbi:PhoH family protein [Mucisphaera calidilacus]|uniref:PhoH-like protein n=1 Tax=Mucisphaera calidilacus TaxID=2527982 RepID=A0A518BYU7_9BACT|nr:PhoH family protein [Mucisphaera calidilacus]QDU72136.1 PhoH-like protein [Mucisphaera calidilacus]